MMPSTKIKSTFSFISSRSLVACNIYVSAGRQHHAKTLLSILSKSQEKCRALRYQSPYDTNTNIDPYGISEVAIVHAFTDGPYDRSSFHLAGYANSVAQVASFLTTTAMQSFYQPYGETECNVENTLHPYVGIVDHVSVMPLLHPPSDTIDLSIPTQSKSSQSKSSTLSFVPSTVHGQVAYTIGQHMSAEPLPSHTNHISNPPNIQVFYYGSADPQNTPLAQVRKHKTSFFKSGGLLGETKNQEYSTISNKNNTKTKNQENYPYGTATVGAPAEFVENYNIRLNSGVSRATAVQLARELREIDGRNGKGSNSGLLGVEALTLPYTENRYEVACNLLFPRDDRGNVDAISNAVGDWEERMRKKHGNAEIAVTKNRLSNIECSYRVGTTENDCWKILQFGRRAALIGDDGNRISEAMFMDDHDEKVSKRLETFILG